MANHSGNAGVVLVGVNQVAEVVDYSLSRGVAVIDNSALDDNDDTHLAGSKNWSASINCFWDETDTNGQEAMKNGDIIDLHLLPEGAGIGNMDMNGSATVESLEVGLTRNGMVTAAFTAKGNGALIETTL